MYHIMFDIDGTLVQSYDFDETCFIEAVSEVLGHDIDSNWADYEHVTDTGILNEHLKRQGINSGHKAIHQAVKTSFCNKIHQHILDNPVEETLGASALIKQLKKHDSISISLATGGWLETAMLKLRSANIDVTEIPIASSNDHYSRKEIMKLAKKKANIYSNHLITYFGDAEWDRKACSELEYNFVLVGNRINHTPAIHDMADVDYILSLVGL